MNQTNIILPILAILSVAALIGGFAIKAADAAMVPQRGVRIGLFDVRMPSSLWLLYQIQIYHIY